MRDVWCQAVVSSNMQKPSSSVLSAKALLKVFWGLSTNLRASITQLSKRRVKVSWDQPLLCKLSSKFSKWVVKMQSISQVKKESMKRPPSGWNTAGRESVLGHQILTIQYVVCHLTKSSLTSKNTIY